MVDGEPCVGAEGPQLGNEAFVKNAPAEVVAEQQKRLDEASSQRATYLESIESLRG